MVEASDDLRKGLHGIARESALHAPRRSTKKCAMDFRWDSTKHLVRYISSDVGNSRTPLEVLSGPPPTYRGLLSKHACNYSQSPLLIRRHRDVVTGDLSTLEDWISVLALATKYEFEAHRALAIERLSRLGSPTDRLVLAREYDIPGWLEEAYYLICIREDALTLEEGHRLGMEDVIALADLRQRIRAHVPWGYTLHEPTVRATIRAKLHPR